MDGCTAFDNTTADANGSTTTTIFVKDGAIMGKRIVTTYLHIKEEAWQNANGKLHRDGDLPAYTKHMDGSIVWQTWAKDGGPHRDGDEPATIYYDKNGKVVSRHWCKNGKSHRDGDLPAVIHYDGDKITNQLYYKDDVKQPAPKPEESTANILARISADLATLQARLAENAK